MGIRSIKELDLKSKKVLIRVDFNVPLDEEGTITDDSRIREALPTIQYAMDQGGKVILMSHLGRPKGKVVKSMSLLPVARQLSELLGTSVNMAPDCVGDEVKKMVDNLSSGDVILLENLRFHIGEEKNDPEFAKKLSELGECYVNDAFATAHRAHASNVGICDYIKETAAGFLMLREVEYINKALKDPKRPYVAVIGGAKVSGKLEVLENLIEKVNKIIIGGGMAFTFIKALGQDIGKSLVEDDLVDTARTIMEKARSKGVKLYLPVDCVCAPDPKSGQNAKTVTIQEIPADLMGLDIGPASVSLFSEALDDCSMIVWNGPMGVFEQEPFSHGTMDITRKIANSKALTIVGGGDTDAALHKSGLADKVDFVSTAGGAFLEMLGGAELPGVKSLER
ncbi:MAG: phosphoglycerate kinase [Desulfomonilia bacterium]|jgi:phosphoglycerate kinase|uniref:phosphoglycerate kinase n=1 Tax=anaerobic digester metagenome TaxID=1263854 RepID=A0A485LYE5_9ZZZZ|nr:phosphoglycerate kinase [Pseudomonadota bacterium]HON38006.1 phosphoglycerate kinase [Deltaproteobacteria bacterium]HRS55023.1 phosphoglycerate kinase [Desulfomonilia bacterium]HPD20740.1 phosphoglycerate kinase [Deltaproteobacteria bacterium]HPX18540.1 phosphoglycerate kinase [Deltaproteobacteria bacterium]